MLGGGGQFHDAQVESPRGELGIATLTPVTAAESRGESGRDITMPKQGLPQDDFESPPLEALQTISKLCREFRLGNANIFNHWADVQAVVQSDSVFREGTMESFQGVQKSSSFGVDVSLSTAGLNLSMDQAGMLLYSHFLEGAAIEVDLQSRRRKGVL